MTLPRSPVWILPAAALGALGLLAALAWAGLPPLLFGLPLYARIQREHILDHRARDVVYERIRQEPGVSTHELARLVDFGWSTLTYHLRVLERAQKVIGLRDGRYKRFFDRESGRYANGRKLVVATLRHPGTRAVGRLIRGEPGLCQKEVGARLGLAPSSVHWHIARLVRARLVDPTRDGHHVRYRPGSAWADVAGDDATWGGPTGLVPFAGPSEPGAAPQPA